MERKNLQNINEFLSKDSIQMRFAQNLGKISCNTQMKQI